MWPQVEKQLPLKTSQWKNRLNNNKTFDLVEQMESRIH